MRWVLCNTGDETRPEIRARIVVQETKFRSTIAAGDIAATFSATPPIEALRMILSLAMTLETLMADALVIGFIDISRAHPHAVCQREIYVYAVAEQ